MPTHRIRRRSEGDVRRRRHRNRDDFEEQDRYVDRLRTSFGWVIAVGIIGLGIFWLATSNPSDPAPPTSSAATDLPAEDTLSEASTNRVALGKPQPSDRKERGAIQSLEAMRAAYAQVDGYEDEARMLIRFPMGNQIQEDRATLRLQFLRPDQVRLEVEKEAHRVIMASDGQNWRARIVDPTTNNFDNQFVLSPSEEAPTVAAIYKAAEYVSVDRPNEMLNALMSLPAPLLVSQLSFLLEPDSINQMIETSSDLRSLSEQSIQGRPCDRIRVTTDGGSFVFWIDQRDHLLRRIQFPTGDRQPGTPTTHLGKSMLQCDYGRIRLESHFAPGTFQPSQPDNARVVRNFVLPPPQNTQSPINKRIDDFWFTDLRNQRTPATFWDGKLGVFVWWNNDAASRTVLEQLSQVAESLVDDRRVALLAVSSIPSTQMSHRQVQQLADQWDIGVPIVRDLEAFGRDKFRIEQSPAIVMIDAEGKVQLHEAGDTEVTADQMTTIIEKLLAGDDLAEQYFVFLAGRDKQYAQLLATAGLESPQSAAELESMEIEPASSPDRLKLTELWTNDQIQKPGNILTLRSGLRDLVLVNSGLEQIVELTSYGSLKGTIEPRAADTLMMTTIRTATDRTGRRYFLTLAYQGESVHVFDDRWQHQLSYPQEDTGEQIQDAQLADLDDDGELELYVALTGSRGVHRVNGQGRREWTNQTVAPVLSLTVSPDNSGRNFLLVTNDRGKIEPLDADGARQQSIAVPSWSIHHLVAAPTDQSRAAGYCGISQMPDGSLVAVGMDASMSERWSQPVARGTFGAPVDFIKAAAWGPRGELYWILAAPTGKIHVISQDGQFHDEFSTGTKMQGLAGYRSRRANILIAATDNGVIAWEVEFSSSE